MEVTVVPTHRDYVKAFSAGGYLVLAVIWDFLG